MMQEQNRPKLSIITIVNKEDVYAGFKRELLKQKDVSYELIKINNDHQQFSSARAAYNSVIPQISGELAIFLHPDIRFLDEYALRDIVSSIESIGDFGVVGVAGTPTKLKNGYFVLITNIKQGLDAHHVGTTIDQPVRVQTVDECFFVMKRDYLLKKKFTDISGWHLYAVEQCLRALIDGKVNYVIPARIWHVSDGVSEDINYVRIGNEIVKRYGKYFPIINTTVYKWETHGIKRYYMPWMHFVDHKLVRAVRDKPVIYQTAKRIKHLFIKP